MRPALIAAAVAVATVLGAAAGFYLPRHLSGTAAPEPGSATPAANAASAAAQRPAVAVEAMAVAAAQLDQRLNAVGSLVADDSVMVRPEIAGRISSIAFREGQSVRRGDVLLQLDDSIVRAEYQQASANHELAVSKFKRADELQREGFMSRQSRDEASNTAQVERANLALAKARMDKSTIRAPFDGQIGLRSVSVGDYVTVGQDLVTLQAIDQLKVDFRIPELYLPQIRIGQRLELTVDALPKRRWQAEVTAISPLVDVAGRALLMRAQVDNADGALRPGMFARVNLLLAEGSALLVPETALGLRNNGHYVYRVEDGQAREVPIRIGQRRGGMVEVLEGLQAGDQVVTAGLQKIQDGTRVAVTLVSAS
ncbi:efflux RND transporter periplasmic adaptor subunit [Verticiella sediminum]|uniref:Efflux RND transporter periplasmic adaptor subunit n=1 Tax=Verticiella sediminum TaxID=1247510 RepID=A0A556ABV4_9BURK|nr:efflux RND transporter periplasmic adaptor subunit [Verticiella sediminum]TSH90376.1 efflux RND transporter periplasmic adaptor subunit [Verticiella sediminum]